MKFSKSFWLHLLLTVALLGGERVVTFPIDDHREVHVQLTETRGLPHITTGDAVDKEISTVGWESHPLEENPDEDVKGDTGWVWGSSSADVDVVSDDVYSSYDKHGWKVYPDTASAYSSLPLDMRSSGDDIEPVFGGRFTDKVIDPSISHSVIVGSKPDEGALSVSSGTATPVDHFSNSIGEVNNPEHQQSGLTPPKELTKPEGAANGHNRVDDGGDSIVSNVLSSILSRDDDHIYERGKAPSAGGGTANNMLGAGPVTPFRQPPDEAQRPVTEETARSDKKPAAVGFPDHTTATDGQLAPIVFTNDLVDDLVDQVYSLVNQFLHRKRETLSKEMRSIS